MSSDRGGAVAARLAQVFADTHARSRAASAGHEAAVRSHAADATLERWERNMARVAKTMLGAVLADPDISDEAKTGLRQLTDPAHQVSAIFQFFAMGLSIFSLANAAVTPQILEITHGVNRRNPQEVLSPAAAAEMVVRGVLTDSDAAGEAVMGGYDRARFDKLVEITGEPLATQELLQAYRRGIIDTGRLEHGIRQGRTRNEWIDVVKALRYQPPGAGAAIAGAVQGFLTPEQARSKAEEAGLDPDDFLWMFETAGNPPGNETMLELLNRGDMSEAEVRAGLRESNLKNKYIDAFIKSRRRLIPQDNVRMALRAGVITTDEAIRRLMALGYDRDDAAVLAGLGHAEKTQASRDLARGQVVDGYLERFFTRERATEMLEQLGYDRDEAGFLLDLADHARERRFTDAAVGRFRTLYVRRRVDRGTASNALDRLGVPPGQRDDLLELWGLERDADTPDLSAAQWGGLLRRGVIDVDRHNAELSRKGYSDEEAMFLAYLAFPPGKAGG